MRMDKMPYIDQSGLYAIEDVLTELVKDGKKVLLVTIPKQPRYMLEKINIIPDLIPVGQVFLSYRDCLIWIKEHAESRYR